MGEAWLCISIMRLTAERILAHNLNPDWSLVMKLKYQNEQEYSKLCCLLWLMTQHHLDLQSAKKMYNELKEAEAKELAAKS